MAADLLKAGHQVIVYNRTPAKVAPLVAQGAKAAASVADACRGDAIVTMLANDEAVASVTLGEGGIIASLPKGAIHTSSSIISVALSEELANAHGDVGQHFVAAPVFGRPEAAAAGQLFVIAAGAPAAIETARPVFDAIGQKTFVVSETPETANLVKLSGNFLTATVIESLGEAMALVSKRRPASVSRHLDFNSVRRACLQDLWGVDRRQEVRAGWLRGAACPAGRRSARLRPRTPARSGAIEDKTGDARRM